MKTLKESLELHEGSSVDLLSDAFVEALFYVKLDLIKFISEYLSSESSTLDLSSRDDVEKLSVVLRSPHVQETLKDIFKLAVKDSSRHQDSSESFEESVDLEDKFMSDTLKLEEKRISQKKASLHESYGRKCRDAYAELPQNLIRFGKK